jgi:tol-pal system protein YbgF
VQSSPPPAPLPGGRRADVFDPSQHPNAPGAPRALGGPQNEPPPVVTADPQVGAPGGRHAGAPLDLSTMANRESGGVTREGGPPPGSSHAGALPAPPPRNYSSTGAVPTTAPPSDSPKDTYDLAYGYVLRKDYALAEQTFQAFLKKYPSDRRAADAQFWLGESLFQRQRYDAAAQAFLDLSTKHGTHPKAPESLLRLAQSLEAMKQKEMACATLAEVGRKYPKASASVKQGVEREQKRGHC